MAGIRRLESATSIRAMSKVRRALQVAKAFVRMGWLLETSYPLSFVMTQVQSLLPVFTYFFVDRLIPEGQNVAGDYFTFVVIGLLSLRLLVAGTGDLSSQMDEAIQQGRLEMLLVEPIRWRFLPYAMVQWPFVVRLATVAVILAVTVPLGANYRWVGLPMFLLINLAGTVATLAIGTLAMGIKVISKRADPVLAVYLLAGQILSGALFPLEVLPGPLRAISAILPQTYVISGARAAFMPEGGTLSGPSPLQCLALLTIFGVVAHVIALRVLARSLEYARRLGVLGGY